MVGVNKYTPTGKHIIKDVYLSFYYGAKIGILGMNGAGKSTVMKIIAGLDQSYQGDVVWSPGSSVGFHRNHNSTTTKQCVKSWRKV